MGKTKRPQLTSGIDRLDQLLGNLFIGDNVIWYDDAGSLAWIFCLNFIRASGHQDKDLIYVSFDRSPKTLLEKLGKLAEHPKLIILDCFTNGKGRKSDVFEQFYRTASEAPPCRIVRVDHPHDGDEVSRILYAIHRELSGDVRFVFESLTGMQDLWNGEENVLKFYSHSCPRLYELNTVAYWIIEKRAHTPRLRAQINQIAQVAIDLSFKRGKHALTLLKAEARELDTLNRPYPYWTRGLQVSFEEDLTTLDQLNLGSRLKELRIRGGFSQTRLARMVGVTPSTISQVESNLIYPSLQALWKMAEVLGVEMNAVFPKREHHDLQVVFPSAEAENIRLPNLPPAGGAKLLLPEGVLRQTEAYLLEIAPFGTVAGHFFKQQKDEEEVGYVLEGKLHIVLSASTVSAGAGDLIHLGGQTAARWENPGAEPARLLWLRIRQSGS